MADPGPRRSFGGRVVEESLAAVGFRLPPAADVALVETVRPAMAPYRRVLAQNAWNVISSDERRTRLRTYPAAQRARFHARHQVTRVNLRRAERVVCLTHAMAELCAPWSKTVEVAPVTVPMDFLRARSSGSDLAPGTMLVPGTVAPYKNPATALDVFAEVEASLSLSTILFGGGDDGSGVWSAVQAYARARGIAVERRVLDRAAMRAALASAAVVVVPSGLESLSFSLAETLLLSDRVIASPIAAHREVAARLGRQPTWLGSQASSDVTPRRAWSETEIDGLRAEWVHLGAALGLDRVLNEPGESRGT